MKTLSTSLSLGALRFPNHFGACFVAGTLVHTDKGLVPIEQLRVGDLVLSQPETTGEKAYRRVINTFAFDDKPIRVIRFAVDDFPSIRHQCYVTDNHPFWVEGVGWTPAGKLRVQGGEVVQLADGTRAEVLVSYPIWRTPQAGFGWVAVDVIRQDSAHIVDFRSGTDFSKYNIWEQDQLPARFIEGNIEYLAGMRSIWEGDDPLFRTRVYNIEVEEFQTFYIGDLGVWVHNHSFQAAPIKTLDVDA
jgi:hypothetical protein